MPYKQAQLDGQPGVYDDEADQFYPQSELKSAALEGQEGFYHPKSDLFIPMGESKLTPSSVGMAREYPSSSDQAVMQENQTDVPRGTFGENGKPPVVNTARPNETPNGATGEWTEDPWYKTAFKGAKRQAEGVGAFIEQLPQHLEKTGAAIGMLREDWNPYEGSLMETVDRKIGVAPPKTYAENLADYMAAGKEINRGLEEKFGAEGAPFSYEVTQNIIQNLPGIVMSAASRSVAPALTLAGIQSGVENYAGARSEGYRPLAALAIGGAHAGFEVAGEKLGLDVLFKKPLKSIPKTMVEFFAKDLIGEEFTTTGQDLTDKVSKRRDLTLGQYLDDLWHTAKITATTAPILGGIGTAVRRVAEGMEGRQADTPDATFNNAIAELKRMAGEETTIPAVQPQATGEPLGAMVPGQPMEQPGAAEDMAAIEPALRTVLRGEPVAGAPRGIERRVDRVPQPEWEAMTPDEQKYAAHHDYMTGLKNRRSFETAKPDTVGLIDLDGFGKVNKDFDQTTGDNLLTAIADSIKGVGGHDWTFRLNEGGDELVVGGNTWGQVTDRINLIDNALKRVTIEGIKPDGSVYTLEGPRFSYGIDKDYKGAAKRLLFNKQTRLESGERVKGDYPRGMVVKPKEAGARSLEDEVSLQDQSRIEPAQPSPWAESKKAVVPISDVEKDVASELLSIISQSTPERKIGGAVQVRDERGDPTGERYVESSNLPNHLRDQGIQRGNGKTDELLNRLINGEPMTDNQYNHVKSLIDMHSSIMGHELEQQPHWSDKLFKKKGVMPSEKEGTGGQEAAVLKVPPTKTVPVPEPDQLSGTVSSEKSNFPLRPANRLDGTDVFIGEIGKTHADINSKMPDGWWNRKVESGWVDRNGNWLSKTQAAKIIADYEGTPQEKRSAWQGESGYVKGLMSEGKTPTPDEMTLEDFAKSVVGKEQPALNLGTPKGMELRAPERENKPVSMDDLPLGRAMNEAADREKQGGLFDKMKNAYKRSALSSEGGSVGEKEVAPAFYSKAESLVKQFLPDNAIPQTVRDLMKQHKVKADDLAHSGIEEFLAENEGKKISKPDLLAFMQEKQAKIVPVEFGENGIKHSNELIKFIETHGMKVPQNPEGWIFVQAEAEGKAQKIYASKKPGSIEQWEKLHKIAEEAGRLSEGLDETGSTAGTPKFSNWKLPGESIPGSYVEHFETLGKSKTATKDNPMPWTLIDETGKELLRTTSKNEEGFSEEQLRSLYGGKGKLTWEHKAKSEHYIERNWQDGHAPYAEVENPIVRWRGDGRLDAQDRKTFFIHEIQAPSAENQAKMPKWAQKRWREIGLKSALDYAVKNGYDSLSLASGEQVAGLYDLSKQVDAVRVTPELEKGKYSIEVVKAGDRSGSWEQLVRDVPAEKIADHVGKDIARKVGEGQTVFHDVDLKVGAEGLRKLYDRDLPGILNDMGKKWGARVKEATLTGRGKVELFHHAEKDPTSGRYVVVMNNGKRWGSFVSEKEAISEYQREFKTGERLSVSSIDIPPSMRSDVTYKGQELYSVAFANPKVILKNLRAVKDDAKAAYPHLVELGRGVYEQGHTKFFEFKAQMKKLLGDMWDGFKHLMEKLYFAAKRANKKLGERGAIGEGIPEEVRATWMKAVEEALAAGKTVPDKIKKQFLNLKGAEMRGEFKKRPPAADELKKAADDASATLKDFIDKTPKAGLSIADISKQKRADDNLKMPADDTLKSVNKDVEFRWQKSKGITQKGLMEKIKEHALNAWELRKTFPGLDYKEDAKVINILREFAAVPEYSKHLSAETTAGILAGLGPKKYDIFTRNIVLPDIIKDIDSGLLTEDRLPFGYKNKSEVQKDLVKFGKIADSNPDIKSALARREAFQKALTTELVNQDLLPKEVLEDPRYFHHQVLQYMDIKKAYPGTSSKDVREHKKGFQRGRKGSSLDYNTEYVESEFEYVAQALGQIKTKEIVDRIGKAADISAQVKADAKAQGLSDWRKAIPEGFTAWQPKPGTQWYKALSVPQRVIDEVLAGNRELTAEDLREVIAKGGPKQQWVIPERVAKVLDNFRDFSKDEGFDRFVRATMATWKQWVLMNPVRVLKYNINNMSGDLDIALAYDPRILKYFKEAAGEAWQSKKGAAMTRDMREAVEYGVISSGFTIQEIPDIKDIGLFRVLTGNEENIIARYWEQTKELTQFRENILRIAAYKYFKEQIAAGGRKIYGASRRSAVDAETDPKRKAAMLARDLIGDYGNISAAGQWLRQRMIPFWSWMEINAPRYLRLIRNASYEGKSGAGAAGKATGRVAGKAALKTAKVILQANILYAAAMAWNAAMESILDLDDDEKRALYSDRKQMHIILGKSEDGQVQTLRIQGALSDALDWMALGNWPDVVKDIMEDKTSLSDQARAMGKAPINRIVNASHPMLKTAGEVITGKQIYPDVFSAKPIRDKGEHVSRLFSLDIPYRYLTGKPSRGAGQNLLSVVAYSNDPGERSYWVARKLVYDHMEKSGKEIPSAEPTDRSNALYYYKQSRRYQDSEAEERFMQKYIELGGTIKGLRESVDRGAPLGSLSARERWQYLKTVSPEDKQQINLAEKWYKAHMSITPSDTRNFLRISKGRRYK